MVVFTTINDSDLGFQLARQLVDRKLAACVSISSPVQSIYQWKNKIEVEMEWQLMIKTRRKLFPHVTSFIRENHPYDVPEIFSVKWEEVEGYYARWMFDNTIEPDE